MSLPHMRIPSLSPSLLILFYHIHLFLQEARRREAVVRVRRLAEDEAARVRLAQQQLRAVRVDVRNSCVFLSLSFVLEQW